MPDLSQMTSTPDKSITAAMPAPEIERYRQQLPDWQIVTEDGEPKLKRAFTFKNFREALDFTDRVGALADQQDHHPALLTEWGKVTVSWWTHKVHGLHLNDFILAAKTDALYKK